MYSSGILMNWERKNMRNKYEIKNWLLPTQLYVVNEFQQSVLSEQKNILSTKFLHNQHWESLIQSNTSTSNLSTTKAYFLFKRISCQRNSCMKSVGRFDLSRNIPDLHPWISFHPIYLIFLSSLTKNHYCQKSVGGTIKMQLNHTQKS